MSFCVCRRVVSAVEFHIAIFVLFLYEFCSIIHCTISLSVNRKQKMTLIIKFISMFDRKSIFLEPFYTLSYIHVDITGKHRAMTEHSTKIYLWPSSVLNTFVKRTPAHEIMVLTYHIGDQRRLRLAGASAQSHQSLRCAHKWSMKGSDQK